MHKKNLPKAYQYWNHEFIQRQNNTSTILPHEAKQVLPYIKQNL